MNRKTQIIAVLLLITICANAQKVINKEVSPRYFYSKNKTEILYDKSGSIIGLFKRSYINVAADVNTFEPLSENLAKDGKHVFYKNEILPELDAATCSYDKESKIIRDKNRVFLFETEEDVLLYEVLGADPQTYKYVTENFPPNWWRDKNHYYYRHNKTKVDRTTFRWDSINDVYKDKKNVFASKFVRENALRAILDADPESYKILQFGTECCPDWSRDKNTYYYDQKKVRLDPRTLKFDICSMPYDKDYVYIPTPQKEVRTIAYDGKIQILGPNVMASDNQVFFDWGCAEIETKKHNDRSKIRIVANDKFKKVFLVDNTLYVGDHRKRWASEGITGVDFGTYRLCLPDSTHLTYGVDKLRAYWGVSAIPNADPATFKVVARSHSKDKNTVYYLDKILKEADAATFEAIGNSYAKDKNAVYYKNIKLENADPNTFVTFDKIYGKDKKNVYDEGILLKGYKPEKFEKKNGRYPHQTGDTSPTYKTKKSHRIPKKRGG